MKFLAIKKEGAYYNDDHERWCASIGNATFYGRDSREAFNKALLYDGELVTVEINEVNERKQI